MKHYTYCLFLIISLLVAYPNVTNAAQRIEISTIIEPSVIVAHNDSLVPKGKNRGKPWAIVSVITNVIANVGLGSFIQKSNGFTEFSSVNLLVSTGLFFVAFITNSIYLSRKKKGAKSNGWSKTSFILSGIFIIGISWVTLQLLIEVFSVLFCVLTLCFL